MDEATLYRALADSNIQSYTVSSQYAAVEMRWREAETAAALEETASEDHPDSELL